MCYTCMLLSSQHNEAENISCSSLFYDNQCSQWVLSKQYIVLGPAVEMKLTTITSCLVLQVQIIISFSNSASSLSHVILGRTFTWIYT